MVSPRSGSNVTKCLEVTTSKSRDIGSMNIFSGRELGQITTETKRNYMNILRRNNQKEKTENYFLEYVSTSIFMCSIFFSISLENNLKESYNLKLGASEYIRQNLQ